MSRKPIFYGWILVPALWLIYGFGVAPGYYSWGLFLPRLLADLDFSRAEAGTVFSLFLLCSTALGPLVGIAVSRWGVRGPMTIGLLVSALGYLVMSQATSLFHCIVGYSVLVGGGHCFSLVIPCQTLASNWFVKYRARIIGVVLTAGGIVGRIYLPFDAWILQHYSWRHGWMVIAGISVGVALLAALFVRTRPEEMGFQPDGAEATRDASNDNLAPPRVAEEPGSRSAGPSWTAGEALRTPQFFLMVVCGLGYAVPWAVVNAYSGDHLEGLGMETEVVASLIGTMALVSILGRLSGSLGDFMAPQKVLGVALALEGIGAAGLVVAESRILIQASLVAVGVGFGMAFISIAAVFSSFFGRRAFATTTGTRFMIGGIFAALTPVLTGMSFDYLGSYNAAFTALAGLSLIGAAVAFLVKHPQKTALA